MYFFLVIIHCSLFFSSCAGGGNWGAWNHWSLCSKTCDSGWQRRFRMCEGTGIQGYPCDGSGEEVRSCNDKKCPGACPCLKHVFLFPLGSFSFSLISCREQLTHQAIYKSALHIWDGLRYLHEWDKLVFHVFFCFF